MSRKKSLKTIKVDTNIMLHNLTCISQFEEDNAIIHLAVIEEIYYFKKGA